LTILKYEEMKNLTILKFDAIIFWQFWNLSKFKFDIFEIW
jgi:hypothetical protein